MKCEWKDGFRRIVRWEIAIEYKACLYFACIMFFYSAWLILDRNYYASVWMIWEMILTAYAVGYMQVYLFRNFDEAEQLGKRELFSIVLCSCLYAGASWGMGWFERRMPPTLLFVAYMLFCYVCVFLCNKIKRELDTKNLNRMLDAYKKGEEHG